MFEALGLSGLGVNLAKRDPAWFDAVYCLALIIIAFMPRSGLRIGEGELVLVMSLRQIRVPLVDVADIAMRNLFGYSVGRLTLTSGKRMTVPGIMVKGRGQALPPELDPVIQAWENATGALS